MRRRHESQDTATRGSGPNPWTRAAQSYVGVNVNATRKTDRVIGFSEHSKLTAGNERQARTRNGAARLFLTSAPISLISSMSCKMRSGDNRCASSCRRASSGKRCLLTFWFGSRSAICRTGCWNHHNLRSTAFARANNRSANDGQWARRAISKRARQTLAAFFAT